MRFVDELKNKTFADALKFSALIELVIACFLINLTDKYLLSYYLPDFINIPGIINFIFYVFLAIVYLIIFDLIKYTYRNYKNK